MSEDFDSSKIDIDRAVRKGRIERAGDRVTADAVSMFLKLQESGIVQSTLDVERWLFRLRMHLLIQLKLEPDAADQHIWENGGL